MWKEPETRRDRRAEATRQRLQKKRLSAIGWMSFKLTAWAEDGNATRRKARALLVKEVQRRYGKSFRVFVAPRLISGKLLAEIRAKHPDQ